MVKPYTKKGGDMKTEKEFVLPVENYKEHLEEVKEHPYIHVERHPEQKERYYAFWGIKVASLIDKSYLSSEKISDIFHEQVKFIQCLLEGAHDQSIELRYLVHPDKENWTKGRIDIALIGRNLSSAFDEAHLKALKMWDNISPLLAMEA